MAGMFAVAKAEAATPPQFSEPHSPVAKAKVIVFSLLGIALISVVVEPVVAVCMTLVFQFRSMVMSL